MKKKILIIISLMGLFILTACSSQQMQTKKSLLNAIKNLNEYHEDTDYKTELKDYHFTGDSYYVIGEKDKYIQLIMYYKERFVDFNIILDADPSDEIIINHINIKYIDIREEIYLNIYAKDDQNPYVLSGSYYEDLFSDVEALSIKDIEWILIKLELL